MRYGHISAETVLKGVGAQLAALRRRARLTQAEFGKRLGYGRELVCAVEGGRRMPQAEYLEAAEKVLLGAEGVLTALTGVMEEIRAAGALTRVEEPEEFDVWHAYAPVVVPELLRTPEYARAVLCATRPLLTDEELEKAIAAQEEARALLVQEPAPLVTCVLEEAVLFRPYGGRDVLVAQLEYLAGLAERRNVEVQVIPTGVEEHPAPAGAFVLREPRGGRRTVARSGGQDVMRTEDVRALEHVYGALRAQALPPVETLDLIRKAGTEVFLPRL